MIARTSLGSPRRGGRPPGGRARGHPRHLATRFRGACNLRRGRAFGCRGSVV